MTADAFWRSSSPASRYTRQAPLGPLKGTVLDNTTEDEVTSESELLVDGYSLTTDRYYDEETHLWVRPPSEPGPARCGFDPLGSETAGDVVAISFELVGTEVRRGESFGSLEAAKFVGPLTAPVSGTIRSHNADVLARPDLVNQDPLASWLVEIELAEPEAELALLLHEPERLRAWFAGEVRRFKEKGMIAE